MKFKTLKELNTFTKEYLTGDFYISGGVIYDIYHGLYSKDIDIYFRTEEDFNKALRELELQEPKAVKIKESKNAVTFSAEHERKVFGPFSNFVQTDSATLQLIRRDFGDPSEVLNHFDIPKLRKYLENGELHEAKTYEDVFIPEVIDNVRGGYARRILRYAKKGEPLTKDDLFRALRTYLSTPDLKDYYSGDEKCPYLCLFNIIQGFADIGLKPSEKHEVFEFILEELHKKYPLFLIKRIQKGKVMNYHRLMSFYSKHDFKPSLKMKLLLVGFITKRNPPNPFKEHPRLKEYLSTVKEVYPEMFL